jgi:hypothetical protein
MREYNMIEATCAETKAEYKQLRNVLTTLQFVYGTRELLNRNP